MEVSGRIEQHAARSIATSKTPVAMRSRTSVPVPQIGTGIRSQTGKGLGIAGKSLEVRKRVENRILVQRSSSETAPSGEWSYVSQAWMQGAGQPRALQRHLRISLDVWPALAIEGALCVFHFGGGRRKAVLQLVIELSDIDVLHLDDWTVWLPSEGYSAVRRPRWLTDWTPSQLEILLGPDRLPRIERALARPRANGSLPYEIRLSEVVLVALTSKASRRCSRRLIGLTLRLPPRRPSFAWWPPAFEVLGAADESSPVGDPTHPLARGTAAWRYRVCHGRGAHARH